MLTHSHTSEVLFFMKGSGVLDKILELLFTPIINDGAAWLGKMFKGLAMITLYLENSIQEMIDSDTLYLSNHDTVPQVANVLQIAMSKLQLLCLGMAVYMIIFKFLKKGFETYVLWTDGDPDADPLLLTTNFFKALSMAMAFPVLYGYLADITQWGSNKVREVCGISSSYQLLDPGSIVKTGLFNILTLFVAIIMLILLLLQFGKRGVEMFVLRLAYPIGCIGLLDSDKAMYKAMCQKLFQCCATIVVQVGLSQLALSVIIAGHPIISIFIISAALSTPKFLQEFMVQSGGGINANTVYHVSRMYQMARGLMKK